MSKIQLQDFVRYGKLFQIYAPLLSVDRQKIMSEYFEYNNTLAEIAKEKKISRQAVLDAIEKSCKKLDEYELKLSLNKNNEILLKELTALKNEIVDEKLKEKVDNILRKI